MLVFMHFICNTLFLNALECFVISHSVLQDAKGTLFLYYMMESDICSKNIHSLLGSVTESLGPALWRYSRGVRSFPRHSSIDARKRWECLFLGPFWAFGLSRLNKRLWCDLRQEPWEELKASACGGFWKINSEREFWICSQPLRCGR